MNLNYTDIEEVASHNSNVIKETQLDYSSRLSSKYNAQIYLKREDLQPVRSYKIRGAYNLMSSLSKEESNKGVVCASAGNHAQGVAYSCSLLKVNGVIFMPEITPRQKVDKVRVFGGKYINIKLVGSNFDEAYAAANEYCIKRKMVFVHPFNDVKVISGQGTVAYEIFNKLGDKNVDYIICPVGGGGLISGVSAYVKTKKLKTKIFGVDPAGAPKMVNSLKEGKPIILSSIDTFVDGAALKTVGDITFKYVKKFVDRVMSVKEGAVCKEMIDLYQSEGIITEPAGALSVSALEKVKEEIKGKIVVCVISGGNNDISRYPEIMERSLVFQGLKHYFIVDFAQKPGELKRFLEKALGPNDDIVRFEYIKKTNKERGAALVGIELSNKNDYEKLLSRMEKFQIKFRVLKNDDLLYQHII